MKKPLISIIIATFNSERTLEKVLKSIKRQTYPKTKIETLIVDGGSTDKTLKIAKKYKTRIISNPETEPVAAKLLGFHKAKGVYQIYLDHDEVMESSRSIEKKVLAMESSIKVHAVAGTGYKSPKGYSISNRYINEFGDPFSFFIYRLSKASDILLKVMEERYQIIQENKDWVVFDLSGVRQRPILELVAGGTMIDTNFFKSKHKKELGKKSFLGQAFDLMYSSSPYIALTKGDVLLHYSSEDGSSFLRKISWRIKNNIYFNSSLGQAGFSGRDSYQSSVFRLKKYLFIPYAFSLLLPLMDSLYLMGSRREAAYIIHFPATLFTAMQITYHFIAKKAGATPKLMSYDSKKVVATLL